MKNNPFRKKEYIVSMRIHEERIQNVITEPKPNVPEGLVVRCKSCGAMIYKKSLERNFKICDTCGTYFSLTAYERLELILDHGSFEEYDAKMGIKDPLHFPEYQEKIHKLQKKTGLMEGIVTGKGSISHMPTMIGVMDDSFLMGSMGTVIGEKVTRLFERATSRKLPVIVFCASGGARMQEGILSLMQMAKISAAVKKHSEQGLLYIAVLTNPTTGGVTASFAMQGDIILAEPGALIGFAGPRVIEQTIGETLPEGFQRSEFLLEHGFIDRIVTREQLKSELAQLLWMHR